MLKTMKLVILAVCISQVCAVCYDYQECQKFDPEILKVHLIPHSHDDVGWLKTVDQYYYGLNTETQNAGVRSIISSVVDALKNNPDRRFIQVETAFFWKWWKDQPDNVRQVFKSLVENGQIEMVNGAWSMNDEAAAHYQSIIDQFTLGFKKINETVGKCGIPKIGWQIDPFGHSREHASIIKQMGFDGLFIGRLDWRDKDNRKDNSDLEFIWSTSESINDNQLFTSIFADFYTAPICYDVLCGEALVDDIDSAEYNVNKTIDYIYNISKTYMDYYKTNNLLMPMGGDFHFQAAEKNYINIDKLIKYFNEQKNDVQLMYSTPSCYVNAVNSESKSIKFSSKLDDFFPYASDPHAFWTGYFSSRPNSKRQERIGNSILQATKQLTSIGTIQGFLKNNDSLIKLEEAMGIMQHHDAITGTEKQDVSQDYTKLLSAAISTAEEPLSNLFGNLLKNSSAQINLNLKTCPLANITVCPLTEDKFLVIVYNPLSKLISYPVRLPVDDLSFKVTSPSGTEIENVDVLPAISNFSFVPASFAKKPMELIFNAEDIPAMGAKTFIIESNDKTNSLSSNCSNITYGTETTGFTIENNTLTSVTFEGKTYNFSQEFLYYESADGDNNVTNGQWDSRASGAYIFRPKDVAIRLNPPIAQSCYRGQFVDEVKQTFDNWITQIIRVYKDVNNTHIEFDWLVEPIEMKGDVGREIITRFTITNLNNSGVFYTDSNGREMLQRTINKRNDYVYNATEEPYSSNYYPITSRIIIQDIQTKTQMAVLNDRAQGGTSLQDGQIELMVHRRILHDDDFGVGEALNETEFDKPVAVRGKHYLIIGTPQTNVNELSTSDKVKLLAQKVHVEPLVLLHNKTNNINNINSQFEFLSLSLPESVHILTFEPWGTDSYLLRLENIFEKSDDQNQNATVDLSVIIFENKVTGNKYSMGKIVETTLGANQNLDNYHSTNKLSWNMNNANGKRLEQLDSSKIVLGPMEIRTFIVEFHRVQNNSNMFKPVYVLYLIIFSFIYMF